MKIGVVNLGRRGAGVIIAYELAQALAQKVDVFAVVSNQANNIGLWRQSGLTLLETETFDGWISAGISLLNFPRLKGLAGQIIAQNADILLFPMLHPWTPFLQRRLSSIPSVVVLHDPKPHPGIFARLMGFLDDYAIRQADRCVILSTNLQIHAQNRGAQSERVRVIPLGIFSYYNQGYNRPTFEEYASRDALLFFGRISPYKGIDILLQAFGELKEEFDWLKLLIVGAGDIRPYRKILNTLKDVELVNRWIGDEEISVFFQQARLVVLPYLSASQSGVVATSAAFGAPVIATRTGGITEQMVNGETGCLVNPGSVKELVVAISKLLKAKQSAYDMGNNLRADYEKNRNWSLLTEAFRTVCEEAVNERGSRQ